ncbi:MAG TPA: AIR synthase family protein [Phycisphaerae bacterium]|nr:AIR synthase family protein [Phycisphaerae bacterium]
MTKRARKPRHHPTFTRRGEPGLAPAKSRRAGTKPGKWPARDLARLLRRHACPVGADDDSPDVLVGPRIGEDAAVVRVGGERLVLATDPVTFAADRIGLYAVTVNANDVAACGARPKFFLATILVPVEAKARTAEAIFADIGQTCRSVGCLWVGGHTERTADLARPIVVGTMVGDLEGRAPVTSGGALAGDLVLVTKGAAIEATALVARERGKRIARAVGRAVLARAREYLVDPGISVVREAIVARDSGARALHDVTEGGVVTGLWEMAEAAGLGIKVDGEAIPVRDETRAVCEAAGIDPLEAIGSGALLAAAAPQIAKRIVAALQAEGIVAAIVGEFLPAHAGRRIRRKRRTERLVPPPVDAVAALYA